MQQSYDFSVPEYPLKRQGLIREEMEEMEEVIFVDEESGSNFAVNLMAAIILDLCDGKHSPQDIANIISESIPESEPGQVSTDTMAILSEFSAYGLITSSKND
jgi:methyltransferase-like protein